MELTIRINQALQNLGVQYLQDASEFIGLAVFPIVPVNSSEGKYFVFDPNSDVYRPTDDRIPKGGEAKVVDWANMVQAYMTTDRGLKSPVDKEENRQADFDTKEQSMITVLEGTRVNQEIRIRDALIQGCSSRKMTPATKWDDPNATIIEDMKSKIETFTKRPNVVVFSNDVFSKVEFHPKIREVLNTQVEIVTPEILARLIGVDKVIVGRAKYNAAKKGKGKDLQSIWSDKAFLLHVAPRPGKRIETAGYTFGLKLQGAQKNFSTLRIKELSSPAKGISGTLFVQADYSTDEKVISTECMYMFENLLS